MASVTFSDVKKSYGNVEVIHGVDIGIADGEFVVLVGPSGCGKSTLLRMLAGLETITAGTVEIDGLVVNELEPKQRDIAMVFQNYALYPHMTVATNMGFSLEHRRTPKAEIAQRVEWAAGILGLTDYLDRYPRELSGGQRQRVAVARALANSPDLILADEPTASLDRNTADRLIDDLASLTRLHNRTLIAVSHDYALLSRMDRIVDLADGALTGETGHG